MNAANRPSGTEGRLEREALLFARHESHPEPGVLAAYHARHLAEGEADAVQDHLAECEHCASLVLDLEELMGAEVDRPVPLPAVTPLSAADSSNPLGVQAAPTPRGRAKRHGLAPSLAQSRWLRIAATVVLGVSLYQFGHWDGRRSARLEALRPEAVVSSRTLLASGSFRGGLGDRVEVIRLPALLSFRLPSTMRGATVILVFKDRDGRALWEVAGGLVPAESEIQLHLRAGALPPGRYEVRATVPGVPPADDGMTYYFSVASP